VAAFFQDFAFLTQHAYLIAKPGQLLALCSGQALSPTVADVGLSQPPARNAFR
jgi:hypothetical protein